MAEQFTFSNPMTVSPQGDVSVDCLISNPDASPKLSFNCFVSAQSEFELAQNAAKQWVLDNAAAIPAYVPPTLDQLKANARQQVVNLLNNLSAPILTAYPEAERAAWLPKETNAHAFMDIAQGERTTALAPMILGLCEKQYGAATQAERLQQVTDKATIIIAKANAWRGLTEYIEAVRSRYDVNISGAVDQAELEQIVADSHSEIEAAKPALGL